MRQMFIWLFGLTAALQAKVNDFVFIENKNPLSVLSLDMQDIEEARLKLSNRMEVFLVSDPKCQKSAVSLCVEAGSLNDPAPFLGTAHFCEHMLFMGSDKYPDTNAFFDYISTHNGTSNAYTNYDRTVYAFSVPNDALDGAVDRFSGFFTSPLFKEEALSKERLAVHQEFRKNADNDMRRLFYVLTEHSNPNHPFTRFSIGNNETLSALSQTQIREWYENHYSADKMHLVIYSSAPLEKQIQIVTTLFSHVPTREIADTALLDASFITEEQKKSLTTVEAINEQDKLLFCFEINNSHNDELTAKSERFLSHLVSQNHKGSLQRTLIEKELIEGLGAEFLRISDEESVFIVIVNLTKKGLKEKSEVISNVFSALGQYKHEKDLIKVYQDYKTLLELSYQWNERNDPFNFVMATASELVEEPLESYPYKVSCISEPSIKKCEKVLSGLTPSNCALFLLSKEAMKEVQNFQTEKWYNTRYTMVPIDKTQFQTRSHFPHLVEKSPFIPKNITLEHVKTEEVKPRETWVENSDTARIFLYEDKQYLCPRVEVSLSFISRFYERAPQNAAKIDFYTYVIQNELDDLVSEGGSALISSNCNPKDLKLSLYFSGFSTQIEPYILTYVGRWKTLHLSPSAFETHKKMYLQHISNMEFDPPYLRCVSLLKQVIISGAYSPSEIKSVMENLTYDEFMAFHHEYIKELYVEGTVAGNITVASASKMWEDIKSELGYKPLKADAKYWSSMHDLNTLRAPQKIYSDTSSAGNAALLAIRIDNTDHKDAALQEVLMTALSNEFFNTLRTKQQTGYIAAASPLKVRSNQNVVYFLTQSTTHSPDELLARFELFFEKFQHKLSKHFSLESVEQRKCALIENYDKRPQNLSAFVNRLSTNVFYHEDVEHNEKMIAALRSVTAEEVQNYARRLLSRQNPRRIAILLTGTPTPNESFAYEITTREKILDTFKLSI
ncbi:MAG: hypothetical protein A3F09_00480 [Chlamydiae bacterium RIFCSPHIGHO2_12_FULL_49_11]|nr:MAG: hypothetical protein A3F09_00480 [Chlamydiae bacterium RIFCSPHIGHO2_12_FULL_49_11]